MRTTYWRGEWAEYFGTKGGYQNSLETAVLHRSRGRHCTHGSIVSPSHLSHRGAVARGFGHLWVSLASVCNETTIGVDQSGKAAKEKGENRETMRGGERGERERKWHEEREREGEKWRKEAWRTAADIHGAMNGAVARGIRVRGEKEEREREGNQFGHLACPHWPF